LDDERVSQMIRKIYRKGKNDELLPRAQSWKNSALTYI